MDNSDITNPNYTEPSAEQIPPEEPELSHTDKLTGILTEPTRTFEQIVKFPLKTIDWLLPLFLLLAVVAITNFAMMSNPEIKMQAKEKQEKQMREGFDKAVQEGRMTREQADQQMEQMSGMGMGVQIIFATIAIFIFGTAFFFLIALIYFLLAKFVLKGAGTYSSVLVAAGLTSYITIIAVILAAIIGIVTGKLMSDTSLAAFLGADKTTIWGWFAAKIDPITIWAYSVLSIGLAKLFRSDSVGKYFILVFGLWIIGSLLFFLLTKAVPFLAPFMGA